MNEVISSFFNYRIFYGLSQMNIEIIISTSLIGLSLIAWYYIFWKPLDYYRDLTEIGFEEVEGSNKYKYQTDSVKKRAINELIKRRKFGEVPPVFPNGWFVILESDDLPRSTVKEVNALGNNLVAWRGESGKSYVADAYCPHLGAHLGVGGKVNKECIQCPFHGWSFNGQDGLLKNIPYTDTIPSNGKLKMWTSVEMNGFIYMWFHAENEEPNWYPEKIPQIVSGEWKYRGRSEFLIACHIQDIQENVADPSHLNIVHSDTIVCGVEAAKSCFKWEPFKHAWLGSWEKSELENESHVATLKIRHQLCFLNRILFGAVDMEMKPFGPGYMSFTLKSVLGNGVAFTTVTPVGPFLQRVVNRFYSSRKLIHPLGKMFLYVEARMIERDMRIWNRKMYESKPIYVKEDITIKNFRKWYAQFYTEHSPKYSDIENTKKSFDF